MTPPHFGPLAPVIPRRWLALAIIVGGAYGLLGGIIADHGTHPPPPPVVVERGP